MVLEGLAGVQLAGGVVHVAQLHHLSIHRDDDPHDDDDDDYDEYGLGLGLGPDDVDDDQDCEGRSPLFCSSSVQGCAPGKDPEKGVLAILKSSGIS